MKVRIALTVEVDPDAWRTEYSLDADADVRADVKELATVQIDAWLRDTLAVGSVVSP